MEKIETERVIIETKYKARDGEIFDNEYECLEYEKDLDFKEFIVNNDEINKGITLDNYQHFLYKYIHILYTNPFEHRYIFYKKYTDIADIKDYLIKDILGLKPERELYKSHSYYMRERSRMSNDDIERSYIKRYNDDFLYYVFEFLFEKVGYDLSHFETPVYSKNYEDATMRGLPYTYPDKQKYVGLILFEHVRKNEQIKVFDFLRRVEWLNIEYNINFGKQKDFISTSSDNISYYGKNYNSYNFDILLVQYIIENDLNYKFYFTQSNKRVYLTLEEVIISLENKDIKKILNKAGSNIVNINKNHIKSKYYNFTKNILKELSIKAKKELNIYDFEARSTKCEVKFYPEEITEIDNKNTIVVRVFNNRQSTILKMGDYLDNKDVLIEKILYLMDINYVPSTEEILEIKKLEDEMELLASKLKNKKDTLINKKYERN